MAYQSKYTGLQIDDILDSVEWKQGKIEDLASIRAGAQKGATALQSYTEKYTGTVTGIKINGETKSGSGIIDLGTISTDISGKVDKVAGKQLSTEDFTTALKNKLEGLSNYDDTELSDAIETLRGDFDEIISGDTTTAIKTFNEVIAFLDGLTDTQDLESIIASIEQQIAGKMDKVTLATVATSGSYNDLSNKPTIPSAVTESTVSGWGFTKNTGTYSKPSGGIPKSDLASAVQTSLGKADTALQSYTEQYKGTVTGVKINGTTKNPSNGVVDLGTVITAHQTLKTINGESIVGSGELHLASVWPGTSKVVATGIWNNYDVINISTAGLEFIPEEEGPGITRWSIHRNGDGTKFLSDDGTYKTISGGGSSNAATSVKINGVSKSPSSGVVDLGYVNKKLTTSTSSSMTLSPNIYYRNTSTSLSTLTITLSSASNSNIINEYFVEFTTSSSGTTVSLPSTIKWANGEAPTFDASTTYQISIVNNLGVVTKFK